MMVIINFTVTVAVISGCRITDCSAVMTSSYTVNDVARISASNLTHFGILECSVTDSRATEAVVTQCLPAKLQAY